MSLLAKVLALLFVAITFNSRVTVACVTLWDAARPSNTCRWKEVGGGKETWKYPCPQGQNTREGEGTKQLQLQFILVL